MLLKNRLFKQSRNTVAFKRQLFITFSELGGVYLKFLQALMVNGPFTKDWAGPGELSIFEAVQYDELDINDLLANEIGDQNRAYFKTIEAQPFAAGSFGQVYLATLHDDHQVAIKVLKPSVSAHLHTDLKMLARLIKLVRFTKASNYVDFTMLFNEFAETTRQETNYIQEARATIWFYDYFKNKPSIVVPRIYEQLSSKHVITQDYIGGVSLAKLLQKHTEGEDASLINKQQTGSDFWWQLELVGKEILHASLWSEFMLGDPHPGNIKFLENNKVGLIDFGIVAKTPLNKHDYFDLIKIYKSCYDGSFNAGALMLSALRFLDDRLAQSIATIERHGNAGSIFDTISNASATDFMKHMTGPHKNNELVSGGGLLRVFLLLVNDGNRYGLHMNTQSASLLRAARMYVQVIRQFSRNSEELEIIHSVLSSEIQYGLENIQQLPEAIPTSPPSFEQALEVLGSWLSQVAESDPSLYSQLRASIRIRNYA
jgi:predicted unusual protein kinase regulating ubiquinone biosynthesis (AarF/ABC1/UbiB family)